MTDIFLRQLDIFKKTNDKADYLVLCNLILEILRSQPETSVIKAIDYLIKKVVKQGLLVAYNSDDKRVLVLPDFQAVI
jgi:hypothetical protein